MKRKLSLMILFTVGAAFLGCASEQSQKPRTTFSPQRFDEASYEPRVDNYLVIFDDSESMHDKYKGKRKVDIARETVSNMNQTMPAFEYNGALRTFGQGACIGADSTTILYGPALHSQEGLQAALEKIQCTGGTTPMERAFDAAGGDLKAPKGRTAVIVVSDGIMLDSLPKASAEKLKGQFADNIIFYPIQVGDDPEGKAFMEGIAKVGQSGFSTNAEKIASSQAMADYVEAVFLTKRVAMPAPPPADSDGDGVTDDLDKCPNTPKGVEVDPTGCWIAKDLKFDFDKADIKPEYHEILDKAVMVMEMNPDLLIEIHGHTDSIGTEEYNQKLSERRAESVREYLVSRGIAGERLTAVGMGKMDPIAPNDTAEGRMQNRRVEFNVANQNNR